ncbi:peptidase S1 [Ahniella affigens]|uniref:Peptidase S1 n=2 Tax=Ahniella affigens TaxID=2021234 RepID=A0A2P1PZ32_9GAMM|nr:peptidase S1 [Ahniella affigens]
MFLVQAAITGLALAFVVTRFFPDRFGAAPVSGPAPVQTVVANAPESYRQAVNSAGPAVVSIYSYSERVVQAPSRVFGDPMLQRFGNISPQRVLEQSLGSGVIMSADGYLLTNFHVISNASNILVGLFDGRVTSAKLIGADRETDLAVLKIDGSQLPTVKVAESDNQAVGDVVLAIGNPYGIGQTVTLGIISAQGRNQLSLSRFEDFIQTDAAINSGNSGGALVNARGELVGINTAQFGQAQGISFAIPAEAAKRVLAEVIEHGEVIRGWIGAEYADTPANWINDNAPRGAMVSLTLPGGPAEVGGLQPGDVIRVYNDQDINSLSQLRAIEAALAPGTKIKIRGSRAGVPFDSEVTVVKRPNGFGRRQ